MKKPRFISHSESLDLVIFTEPVKQLTALPLLIYVSMHTKPEVPQFAITSTSTVMTTRLVVYCAMPCLTHSLVLTQKVRNEINNKIPGTIFINMYVRCCLPLFWIILHTHTLTQTQTHTYISIYTYTVYTSIQAGGYTI